MGAVVEVEVAVVVGVVSDDPVAGTVVVLVDVAPATVVPVDPVSADAGAVNDRTAASTVATDMAATPRGRASRLRFPRTLRRLSRSMAVLSLLADVVDGA